MDEGRKYAILFAATILCARKLAGMEPDKPNFAKEYIVETTIKDAAFILEKVDERCPRSESPSAAGQALWWYRWGLEPRPQFRAGFRERASSRVAIF